MTDVPKAVLEAAIEEATRQLNDVGNWGGVQNDDGSISVDGWIELKPIIAAALLVFREQLGKEISDMRIFCPTHHISDCSPLLNDCSLVIWMHQAKKYAAHIARDEVFIGVSNEQTP